MYRRSRLAGAILTLASILILLAFQKVSGQAPPSGFASTIVSNQWNAAVGLAFNSDGTDMFVWERGGKVWVVRNNQRQLVIDISDEVGGWHDLGMLGFALHPNFDQNGYLYLFYTVDRHHLINFGTAAYNPTVNEYNQATINRLTRYTVTKTATGYTVNPSSRTILIGATKSTGIPQLAPGHGAGSLVFGTDKTLLVSIGDGAGPTHDYGSNANTYYEQALADGILTPIEDVGSFRSLLLDSYNGKILRIDAETGDGIPSNPFYDASRPSSVVSKVYSLGFRNPFKMILRPGTGSHNPADGNPGVLYVGDVGYMTWEELDIVDKPGMNFGWPIYEGFEPSVLAQYLVPNQTAPNPLYQVNGCTREYFTFQDLLKQATPSGQANFPNPCNTSQSIPSTIETFVHARPAIDWKQDTPQARTGIFNGQTAGVVNIGAPGSPVSGPQFEGYASVAGVFYTGNTFPPEYQNTYFFGDYTAGWIRNLTVNDLDKPVAVRDFVDEGAVVVGMATHPTQGDLYYVNFPSEIRRIYYSSNRPPIAVASANQTYGPSPLAIQFTGSNSTDPEGQPLIYSWNFGDGSPASTAANPSHSFTAPPGTPTEYTITLTVRDNQGVTDQTSFSISVNNSPPQVNITSPANNDLYPMSGETTYELLADVMDQEHSLNQLQYQWQTTLHHESHNHPGPLDFSPQTTTIISPAGCDGETYFYLIELIVTDPAGASTRKEVRLYPDCENSRFTPAITWPQPAPITSGTALSATQLNATASYNGTPVQGTFNYTPSSGTVLGTGNGQQLLVTFTPSDISLYNSASKTVLINVLPSGNSGFYRALNLNGPALLIDGNNWEASTGAPNFSYTTNRGVMQNQNVTLIPTTDATRANMIRSSIWGNVNLTVSSVPAGNYLVWVYVWEDNSPTTFSVSLEGTVVQANYNSGPGGTWSKLGPFAATINDGAINVSSTGGHGNLSGLEIWSEGGGTPPANQPPVVANAIPDQNAMQGIPFNFTFAANTFSDPNAGTVLSYSADLSNGGSLPGWLIFNPSTRTFSGTPGGGDVGVLNLRVTASDGAGGSVSDQFSLVVSPSSTTSGFYRALNLNGPALLIDGNNWEASTGAPNFSYTTNRGVMQNQNVTLIPTTDATRANMIRSSIWGNVNLTVSSVPAGNYLVWVYVWEDNSPTTFSVSLEGTVVQANYNSGPGGTWSKLGPFAATINDGAINVSSTGGHGNLSGLEIWSEGGGTPPANQPPVVANAIPDQNAMQGIPFNFAFAANTFSDPNAGTVLSYSADLSNGGSLPGWLIFNPSTRTFSGTPGGGDVGVLNLRVTASDGAGGSVSDQFSLVVSPSSTTSGFYRALNLNGPALLIDGNNWEASTGAPNFSYTTNRGVMQNQNVTLIPTTDATRANMIRSSIWGNVNLTVSSVPAGNYLVWVYVWEDNSPTTFSVSLEGTVVQANYNSGPGGTWNKLGPFAATINDGAINVSSTGGHGNLSGLEIWSANDGGAGAREAFVTSAAYGQEDETGLSAHPNPFSEEVNIEFSASETGSTQLSLFDARGKDVKLLYEGNMLAGEKQSLKAEANDLVDGLYILRLMNGKQISYLKLMITH